MAKKQPPTYWSRIVHAELFKFVLEMSEGEFQWLVDQYNAGNTTDEMNTVLEAIEAWGGSDD